MEITFDIGKDELPIFLAEVDEHLQMLDNNLLHLQKGDADVEIIQTLFRSAHTIKGMSGMIGHRRMTDVTHALETVLDGVRKNSICISTSLISMCLEAVDCLRLLREEVANSTVSDIDVQEIVSSLKKFVEGDNRKSSALTGIPITTITDCNLPNNALQIQARIDANSMASAARAFQLMMVLQDLGEIRTMSPTQEEIESASSVENFAAVLVTEESFEKVSSALLKISCIYEIAINGKTVLARGVPVSEPTENQNNETKPQVKAGEANSAQQSRERRSYDPNGRRISDLTLRMNIEHMDNLVNLVGELITDRNRLQQIRSQVVAEKSLSGDYEQLFETVIHLGRITDQLQELTMSMRMLPIGSMFNRFPRMVHDMSQKVGKDVDLVLHGEDTEMDRTLIDAIYDPLIHLIRNSVDHGIESPSDRLAAGKLPSGTVTLTARHEQGRIIVTVDDDGRGIDGERLRNKAVQKGMISAQEAAALTPVQSVDLMFLAGLSTAEQATEFSGRGVGLDIVKTNIQRVNGVIQVESQPGQGTKFQISLPLTLAIVPSLLIKVQGSTFAIPMVMITETLRLTDSEIKYVNQKPVTLLRGSVLPLIHLAEVFSFSMGTGRGKHLFAVVIQSGKQKVGLIVDSLIGEEEVVVKPLGSFVGDVPGISSATILGNGQVALILDVFNLFKLVGM